MSPKAKPGSRPRRIPKAKDSTARVKRPGLSISSFLVALFVASALVRLAGGTAEAIAREVGDIAERAKQTTGGETGAELAQQVDSILFELKAREAALAERESALALREQDLRAVSSLVEQQVARLGEAESRLRTVMSLAAGAAEGDVAQLTSVYAAMKPKDAAAVFEEMDPSFAAGFLGRMRPETAALIVGALSPGKAYSISVILAGRNVNTPKE